jgi:hypothetical protein
MGESCQLSVIGDNVVKKPKTAIVIPNVGEASAVGKIGGKR